MCALHRDYYFTDKPKLLADVRSKKFLEAARVAVHTRPCTSSEAAAVAAPPRQCSYWYGTSLATVREVAATGKLCLMSLDTQGAEVRRQGRNVMAVAHLNSRLVYVDVAVAIFGKACLCNSHSPVTSAPPTVQLRAGVVHCAALQALRSNKRIDGLYLYINTSSADVLAARQKQRLCEDASTLTKRVTWAKQQVAKSTAPGLFDAVIPNTSLTEVGLHAQDCGCFLHCLLTSS